MAELMTIQISSRLQPPSVGLAIDVGVVKTLEVWMVVDDDAEEVEIWIADYVEEVEVTDVDNIGSVISNDP